MNLPPTNPQSPQDGPQPRYNYAVEPSQRPPAQVPGWLTALAGYGLLCCTAALLLGMGLCGWLPKVVHVPNSANGLLYIIPGAILLLIGAAGFVPALIAFIVVLVLRRRQHTDISQRSQP